MDDTQNRARQQSLAPRQGRLFERLKAFQQMTEQTRGPEPEEELPYRCAWCNDSGWIIPPGKREASPCSCRTQQAEVQAEQQRRNKGKDELNLASVALCDFSRGHKGKDHVILREMTRADGSVFGIQAVTNPKIGLPTAKDQDLVVVLEQMTHEQRNIAKIGFEPKDLLSRLRRNNGQEYRDTRNGFRRLAALLIEQWEGWYHKGQRKTVTVGGFHIIDAYNWPTRKDLAKGADPRCFFTWGSAILESMQKGAWRALDLGTYWCIKDPIARFAYRYALRSLHDRDKHLERTEYLYRNVLGLSWKDNSPAMMARVLEEHLAELPEVGKIAVRITPQIVEFRPPR
jgi:hypothetical protein